MANTNHNERRASTRSYLAGDDEEIHITGEVHGEEERDETSHDGQTLVAADGDAGL